LAARARNAPDDVERRVGDCYRCAHARRIVSERKSEFWLCERSRTEPDRFAKYPRLPVKGCPGFDARARVDG
jgi:hypothetical protein